MKNGTKNGLMRIYDNNDIKSRYIAKKGSLAYSFLGNLADNVCWNALEHSDDKVYLITSASLQEGKTTTAVNLALHIAKRRRKVLLIDANLRNPTIGEVFDIKNESGLIQVICNGIPSTDVVYNVKGYGLHIIPAGKIEREPFEVLTSPKLKDLLHIAKKFYDFVIVDCTAVNFYADPLLLCPLVDQIILSVMADKTEKSDIHIAKAKILNADGSFLGVILNKSNIFLSSV